jgi:hypothetical protein
MKNTLALTAVVAALISASPVVALSSFPDGAAGTGIEGTEEGTPRVTDDPTTTETTKTNRGRGKGRNK